MRSKPKPARRLCSVPQCCNHKNDQISMHKISKKIFSSPVELKKWSNALKVKQPFPKQFRICSDHFEPKFILTPISNPEAPNESLHRKLTWNAFPTLKLPDGDRDNDDVRNNKTILCLRGRSEDNDEEINNSMDSVRQEDNTPSNGNDVFSDAHSTDVEDDDDLPAEKSQPDDVNDEQDWSDELDAIPIPSKSPVLVIKKDIIPANIRFVHITSTWNTDSKLKSMTGIPLQSILNGMAECCLKVRPSEKCPISIEDRILLTMNKLKMNSTFAQIAILFEITEIAAKSYFKDTIQLLAKVMKGIIHWETKEDHLANLPESFRNYSNVRTILDCTKMQSVAYRCPSCRTCTYSHSQVRHMLKVLIGVSPSGAINYVSPVAIGKSSDKLVFNLNDLLGKLEADDVVMMDKDYLIGKQLSLAGIKMVRPNFIFKDFCKNEIERSFKIANSRIHMEQRVYSLKGFKVLSEKMSLSMIPYINDIMIILCALSNLSLPVSDDEKI